MISMMDTEKIAISRPPPGSGIVLTGRAHQRYTSEEYNAYIVLIMEKMREQSERRKKSKEITRILVARKTDPIIVDDVEMYAKNNGKAHHTDMFDLVDNPSPVPVFRRGQPFQMNIRFKRVLDLEQDWVALEFSFGPCPQFNKGTLIRLPIENEKEFKGGSENWGVRLHHHDKNNVTIYVNIPATVPVGVWTLKILSYSGMPPQAQTYEYKDKLHILFNPWCKDDSVYMEDEEKCQEYVLNDAGKIYIGTFNQPMGRPWIYGQFSDPVLPACMLLLERTKLEYTARANPIRIVRAISAIVNSNEEGGVLKGKWEFPDFKEGVIPTAWTGSRAILREYLETGGRTVNYGQCWVFAGITTTVCRTLGIPTRTVTNFVSAHDTDETLTIDYILDKNGDVLNEMKKDSIWNFHAWNECWMARPDLPAGYGGWQVIDSTPQETSEGVQRVGPASVQAIRKGEIGLSYDTLYVYTQVNADVIHWLMTMTTSTTSYVYERQLKMKASKYHVGRRLLTQKVGCYLDKHYGVDDAEDVTAEYKSKESSADCIKAVLNAARNKGLTYLFCTPPKRQEKDMFFELVDMEKVLIGQPFEVSVKVRNDSDQARTVETVISVNSVYYTGIFARVVKKEQPKVVLQPKQEETLSIQVYPIDYMEKIVNYCNMKIFAMAIVKETQQTWCDEDDYMLQKPDLDLEIRGAVIVGSQFHLKIEFTNPLDHFLTSCSFTLEGPNLGLPLTRRYRPIQPRESILYIESLTPRRPGTKKLAVAFNSRELIDIIGSINVEIAPLS